MSKSAVFTLFLVVANAAFADTGSRLVATGGVTSFEGTAGGGITPWALISGYGSREEIQGTVNVQTLVLGDYRLDTLGTSIGIYERFEVSLQKQRLDVGSAITSNTFNLLTAGAIAAAPGTEIEQDIVGLKVRLWGDAVFSDESWQPQISAGLQYKRNQDWDTSLATSTGDIPLPNQGVPRILGATDDTGTDYYLTATNLWLGALGGNNLLANLTLRATKANTFGLLGFGSAADDNYDLEWDGSLVALTSPTTAVGIEFRTQTNRLGGLATEETVKDVFVAYFPNKSWSLTAAYVDLGSLPFEEDATGFYVTVTANL